jgi:hypothetical protein
LRCSVVALHVPPPPTPAFAHFMPRLSHDRNLAALMAWLLTVAYSSYHVQHDAPVAPLVHCRAHNAFRLSSFMRITSGTRFLFLHIHDALVSRLLSLTYLVHLDIAVTLAGLIARHLHLLTVEPCQPQVLVASDVSRAHYSSHPKKKPLNRLMRCQRQHLGTRIPHLPAACWTP